MSQGAVGSQEHESQGFQESTTPLGLDETEPSQANTHSAQTADEQAEGDATASSIQKRRRVTRACDECRKKKIRCDGKQPCTHCTVYSYECSYDQPSNRRRNPAPVFLEAMEKKIHRAESLLQIFFPGVNLDDPRFDYLLQTKSVADSGLSVTHQRFNAIDSQEIPAYSQQASDSDLESMLTSKGALNQDAKGEYAYYGASSGMNFLNRMSEEFDVMVKAGGKTDDNSARSDSPPRWMSNVMMHIPGDPSKHDFYSDQELSIDELPAKETARRLVRYALDDACAILPCVHQPSFFKSFDRIYNLSTEEYNTQDYRFLPLLYVVIALGCLFAKDEDSELERKGYLSATDQGYKYFWVARQLMDVTDCRELVSLQAVIFMILFLQCSAKLATCYAFIGVALRSAIRMGMHRSFKDSFSPIESEMRKRCFWIIRKMDVFVGAMLGLPLALIDDEIDQDYPSEVDDEFITLDGIKHQPRDKTPLIAATNHDFRLTAIVCKIVKCIYPIKGFQSTGQEAPRVYRVRLSMIKDIEKDLKAWEDNLQPIFKPGRDVNPKYMRARNLLRMAFAHVQMMLYRPFLHYVSSRSHPGTLQPGPQACATACVHVSRNIIHITASMNQNGLLVGSYWFTMYTSFFAVLSLVFYALENDRISQDTMKDAIVGRQTLAALAKRSMAADRCTATLTVLFDQIQSKLENKDASKRQVSVTRKRDSSSINPAQPRLNSTVEAMQYPARVRSRTGSQPQTVQTKRMQPQIAPRPQNNPDSFVPGSGQSPGAMMTPVRSSADFSMQAHSPVLLQQQQGGVQRGAPFAVPTQQGPHHPEAPHFSHMMFPSSDPFAYPNQPMLALDRSGALQEPRQGIIGTPESFMPANTAPPDSMHADDFVDVNMLGMPNYPSHTMQAPAGSQFLSRSDMGANSDSTGEQATIGSEIPFPGLDFGEFFGSGDWRQRM